ncbi:LLM class flavin-dependent oxidoreductase [Jiangella endophytica]|uniref:LLM class flavin-dependent oxidoreductase n=1 Tax=Jiangella endophytica TaxID=1623398 RepID=UPI0018E59B94|nr:LLM class flavin-dependent oxidoreductase [Jiangella endophytica]
MPKKLILNATEMSTPGHIAFGLWRAQTADVPRYTDVRYWTELATVLEAGGFDALFLADALGQLDSYRKTADPALVDAVQTPLDDPLLIVSAIATVTRSLGVAVTVSTTYEQPYLLARKFTTLDHLTDGRIGWNIVTSQLDSAARNLGHERQVPHDERYEIAQDFVDVAYKLWEGSWDDGAVLRDPVKGIYADPAKVHAIGHSGPYYSVPSAHLSEPSIQRTPLIFQAGSSPRGRRFAARNAEVVFVAGHTAAALRRNVTEIKRLAAEEGREPDSIKFLASVTVVTAESDAAARSKLRDLQRYRSVEGALTHFSAVTGIDWSEYDLDAPLSYIETESNRSILASLTKDAPGEEWTLRKVLAPDDGFVYGNALVGDGASVASALEALADDANIDGFNISGALPIESYRDLADHVIPELARRGRIRDRIPGRTFRESVFENASPLLPDDHPASRYRGAFAGRPSSAPTLLA